MFTKIKEFFLGKPKAVEAVEAPYKVETPAVETKPEAVAETKPALAKPKKAPAAKPATAKKPRAKKAPAK